MGPAPINHNIIKLYKIVFNVFARILRFFFKIWTCNKGARACQDFYFFKRGAVRAYSQGDYWLANAPLEAIYFARQRAALSSFELRCDCIFQVTRRRVRKEARNGPRQNKKRFTRYQEKKRQVMISNFAIRAFRYVIHRSLLTQNAEETAETIEWKNWGNVRYGWVWPTHTAV